MRRAARRAIRSASHRFTRPLSVLLARPPESWYPAVLSAALLAVSRARSACCSQGRPNAGAPPLAPAPVHLQVYAALFTVSRALPLADLCAVLTA